METSSVLTILILCGVFNILQVQGDAHSLMDIWKEVNNENDYDVKYSTIIYKKINAEQQAIAELDVIVRRHLRTKNSELLANAINMNTFPKSQEKIRDLIENMLKNYDSQLIDDILQDTINDVSTTKSLTKMVNMLWYIYKEGDLKSFELMLLSQIKLFRLYNEKNLKNDHQFLYEYAFVLNKIKKEPIYHAVEMDLKSKLEQFVNEIPENLQYLLFKPYFCLMNAKYSEYVYTAIGSNGTSHGKLDPNSRYIWVWYDSPSIDDTSYIMSEISRSDVSNSSNWKVTLKGTKYNVYYYMMPTTNVVAGWESNQQPYNYIWNIEFIDNERVAFSQNDYLMCSTDNKHDNERRNVHGYKKGIYTSKNEECQWYLGRCDRRKN